MNKDAEFGNDPLKKGTWVAFEYDLWMLKEHERSENNTNISNGVVETWIDVRKRAYPLTLRSYNLIRYFRYLRDDLSKKANNVNLNWPDIHNFLTDRFNQAVEAKDNDAVTKIQEKAKKFCDEVAEKLDRVGAVDGVRVFR